MQQGEGCAWGRAKMPFHIVYEGVGKKHEGAGRSAWLGNRSTLTSKKVSSIIFDKIISNFYNLDKIFYLI